MMAVLMNAQVPGMTSEAYEAITAGPGFMEALRGFDGFLGLHAGGPTDDGWQVFEVWESADKHQAWIDQMIAPNMPPGAADAMTVTYHDLHTAAV
jgi:heme-degrading monooxygenase HmoA